MKNLISTFTKLIAITACALTLGSCSRSEYAMLPKGASYHGVTRVATPVPAAPVAAEATTAPTSVATEAVVAAALAPVITPKPAAAPAKAQPAAAAKPAEAVATNAASLAAVPATAVAPTPRSTVFQRLALQKITRKLDKALHNATARQHDNTASTARGGISGNLRIGIILLLVGLLVGILNNFVGAIIAIIGLIFIVLWLLDQA